MHVETVPVEVSNGRGHSKEGELLLLDGKEERRKLNEGTATGKTPKVLSVDALLKGLVTLLLTFLVGFCSWLFSQVIRNNDRLTMIEAHVGEHARQNTMLISEIRSSQVLLREILKTSAAVQADIENLKEEVRRK